MDEQGYRYKQQEFDAGACSMQFSNANAMKADMCSYQTQLTSHTRYQHHVGHHLYQGESRISFCPPHVLLDDAQEISCDETPFPVGKQSSHLAVLEQESMTFFCPNTTLNNKIQESNIKTLRMLDAKQNC